MRTAVLALLFLASLAHAAPHYYVAPHGSDSSGDGSQARPWATMTHADRALTVDPGGTTVHVAPGTYRGGNVTLTKSRVTWRSDVQWGAKVVGTQWGVRGNNVDIVGFDFDGQGGLNHGITLYGSGSRILNNRLRNICNHRCCWAGAINGHPRLVQGNVIHNIGPPVGKAVPDPHDGTVTFCNKMHGIYVGQPGAVVQNNTISNVTGYGISAHGINCHTTIQHNTISRAANGGIILGRAQGVAAPGNCPVDDHNIIAHNSISASRRGIGFFNRVGSHNTVRGNLLTNLAGPLYWNAAHGVPIQPQQTFTSVASAPANIGAGGASSSPLPGNSGLSPLPPGGATPPAPPPSLAPAVPPGPTGPTRVPSQPPPPLPVLPSRTPAPP